MARLEQAIGAGVLGSAYCDRPSGDRSAGRTALEGHKPGSPRVFVATPNAARVRRRRRCARRDTRRAVGVRAAALGAQRPHATTTGAGHGRRLEARPTPTDGTTGA